MTLVTHPILGAFDPTAPGCWDAEVIFSGRAITLDLSLDDGLDELSALDGLPQTLSDLETLDRTGQAAILANAQSDEEDSAAKLYLTHHRDEFSPALYERLFGAKTPNLANPAPLLSRMVLVRVGLYPEQADARIVLDYSIDPDVTHYLLSVTFNASGEPQDVTLES